MAPRQPTAGFGKPALQLRYFDEDGLAFAFAALGQPGGESFGEAFGREAVASFDAAVGDGESVVEIGGVGEIAHAELVEPVEGARPSFAANQDIDGELLRVHASILAGGSGKIGVGPKSAREPVAEALLPLRG